MRKTYYFFFISIWTLTFIPYIITRKSPPGYIIGGDTLVHAAIARGILLGRNPFLDQTYNVPPNWYPFLYHMIVAGVAKGFSISIEKSMLVLQLILSLLMILVMSLVAGKLWGEEAEIVSMALSLLMLPYHRYPNPKELAPIFGIISLFYLSRRRYIMSGILVGLALWTHYAVAFPLLLFFLTLGLKDRRYILSLIISLIIFSPFVVNILLHSEFLFPQVEDIYAFWVNDTVKRKLLSVLPPVYLAPLVALAGIKGYKRREREVLLLIAFVFVIIIARLSPETLKPFGIKLWSSRFTYLLPYVYVLLSAYGMLNFAKSKLGKFILFFLIPILAVVNFSASIAEDPFLKVSTLDLKEYFPQEHFVEVAEWVKKNIERDDTIAAGEEMSMMINALTGRPVVATMYGHGNTFLNNTRRRKDLEILFLGNCNEKKGIVRKYKVRYIILDPPTTAKDMECLGIVYKIGNVSILKVKSSFKEGFENGMHHEEEESTITLAFVYRFYRKFFSYLW